MRPPSDLESGHGRITMRILLMFTAALFLAACSDSSDEDTVGKEIADDYNKAMDKAREVEEELMEHAEEIEKAVEDAMDEVDDALEELEDEIEDAVN